MQPSEGGGQLEQRGRNRSTRQKKPVSFMNRDRRKEPKPEARLGFEAMGN